MRRPVWLIIISTVASILSIVAVAVRSARDARPSSVTYAASQAPVEKFAPLYEVPPFKLIDQDGKPFTDRDMIGRVWIVDFVFTHCAGPCPAMSSNMAEAQQKIERAGVGFISVTVDPTRDTPAVLKEYAGQFKADESRWKFLTGSREQIEQFARGMNIGADKDKDDSITHSTYFLLVDRAGRVVKIHRMNDQHLVADLVADANQLADHQ